MNMRIIQATRRSFAFRLSECGSSPVLEEGKKIGTNSSSQLLREDRR